MVLLAAQGSISGPSRSDDIALPAYSGGSADGTLRILVAVALRWLIPGRFYHPRLGVFITEVVVEVDEIVFCLNVFDIAVSDYLLITGVELFILARALPINLLTSSIGLPSERSEDLRPLLCPLPPLASPLRLPLPHGIPIPLLSLPDLIAEVHGGDSVHETIFILETLLSHIQGLLHSHGEGHAEGEHEAC